MTTTKVVLNGTHVKNTETGLTISIHQTGDNFTATQWSDSTSFEEDFLPEWEFDTIESAIEFAEKKLA